MKTLHGILILIGAFSTALHAAENQTYPYQDKGGNWCFKYASFKNKSGYFDVAKNWSGDKLPLTELPLGCIPAGVTVTLSTPFAGQFSSIYLNTGSEKKSVLVLNKNASLSVGGLMIPSPYGTGSPSAEVLMQGGNLVIGDIKEPKLNTMLGIGTSETCSSQGRFVISGGTLQATIFIGSQMSNTASGSFAVEGSQPVISGVKEGKRILAVCASGTLEFIFDENGVASMDYRKGALQLKQNATLRADGTRYKGPPKNFTLVQTENITRSNPINLEVTGFSPAYHATFSFEKQGVVLKVQKAK